MKRIRELRNKKGLSGEKLGEIVGVQKSAISKYERGEIQPSNEVLLQIANTLNTSTDYLLGNTDDPTPPNAKKEALSGISIEVTEDEKQIIDNYRSFNEEGQGKIIVYIDDLITSGKYIKSHKPSMDEEKHA